MLRLAFPTLASSFWTAGTLHVSSLVSALRDTYGQQIGLYAFRPSGSGPVRALDIEVELNGTIPYEYPARWSPAWAGNWMSRHLRNCDVSIQAALEPYGIEAALVTGLAASYGRIATLWSVTDFQHVKFPGMFKASDRAERNADFLRSGKLASRIIVMSNSVRDDFEAFAPQYASKIRVLQPVSYIDPSVYEIDPLGISRSYSLPEKFVYLPNQFWKHKNHELVLEAVRFLKENGLDIHVVCTGNPHDYRHPLYFAEFFQRLSAWGIRDRVIYLGLVARHEVLSLIRQSVCVLNPSLFEGWGYGVDEARSVGKRVVASDIPPHREQNPAKSVFFDPHDWQDLATKLAQVWTDSEPGPDLALEAAARRELAERRRAYAEGFLGIAREAVGELRG